MVHIPYWVPFSYLFGALNARIIVEGGTVDLEISWFSVDPHPN